jgi:pimeloyl-ACP methyl ester carboxylesterase
VNSTGYTAQSKVLLVPGGACPAEGYFPQLGAMLSGRASIIEVDVLGPGDVSGGWTLGLAECASRLAQVARAEGNGALVVVGHGLGGLVALRLVVDEPGLVDGLLLLDPTPPAPPMALKVMSLSVRALVGLGPLGQRLRDMRARSDWMGVPLDAEQERALSVFTDRRYLAEAARWAGHLSEDGSALASDLVTGGAPATPVVIVSPGYRRPVSPIRRGQQQLAAWMPNAELVFWADAPYPLHVQQPARVADWVLTLLQGAERARATGG